MGAAGFRLLRKRNDAGFSRFTVGRESSRVRATSTVFFGRMETKFGARGWAGVGFKIDDEGRNGKKLARFASWAELAVVRSVYASRP